MISSNCLLYNISFCTLFFFFCFFFFGVAPFAPMSSFYRHDHANNKIQSGASPHSQSSNNNVNQLEVFVSCLPYACDEKMLFDLFNKYYHVIGTRIVRNERNITQLYGFVTLCNVDEVQQATKLMNNYLFEGRKIK